MFSRPRFIYAPDSYKVVYQNGRIRVGETGKKQERNMEASSSEPASGEQASKKQRVVHLSPAEHCLQRPEMYVGSMEPCETTIPDVSEGETDLDSQVD